MPPMDVRLYFLAELEVEENRLRNLVSPPACSI